MARGLQEAGSTLTRSPKSDDDGLGHQLKASQMRRSLRGSVEVLVIIFKKCL
ncbi:hypothetical protein SynA18461_00581 [Synechococcus sp. A18-46.1]|nr:hypothetical protein SynA18461_00581 [Synechococcus sp. A18-46.1]